MKTTLFILSFVLVCSFVNAQGRDPAGVGRSPAGARSGYEGGGANRGGSDSGGKSGKDFVSNGAKEHSAEIISINSPFGDGKMNDTQRGEAIRQLGDAKTNAEAKGNRADARHYDAEMKKLGKEDIQITPRPFIFNLFVRPDEKKKPK